MSDGKGKCDFLALPDEVLERVASHLCVPDQLLTLGLTCKQLLTVSKAVAQRFIDVEATDDERNNLPQVDLPTTGADAGELVDRNWGVVTKYHLILKHRYGLQFDQIVGAAHHVEGDKFKIVLAHPAGRQFSWGLGSSNRIMRSGVHKAKFEIIGPAVQVMIGISRPMDYSNESSYDDRYSSWNTGIKAKYLRAWRDENKVNSVLWNISLNMAWVCKGQRDAESLNLNVRFDPPDKTGFLLDFEKRTLSFYRNGTICRVVSGLVGEYVWVVKILGMTSDATSIRISGWD